MTMGARRRSPPPLLRLSSQSVSSSSAFQPNIPPPLSRISGHSSPAIRVFFLVGIVACAWLAGTLTVMSHFDEPREHLAHFPIPMSTGRSFAHPRHQNRHIDKLPHYFQLPPPATTEDSPPWSWPIVHIVNTRFMQGQGTLVNLARSRLKLLEAVCLPSLMEQTIFDPTALSDVYRYTKWEEEVDELSTDRARTKVMDPSFLWIIKVDPNMDTTLLDELKAVLEPVRNFTLVVGSNTNFGIGIKPGGWRDGQAGQNILDAYDSGHVFLPGGDTAHQMIRRAHAAREDRVVIETRLDADDAVHVEYVAALQTMALRTLVDTNVSEYDGSTDDDGDQSNDENKQIETARWLYWCPHAHVQWNPSSGADSENGGPGMLGIYKMPNTCVTTGLSLGFAVGTSEENVPRYEHSKLYWQIAIVHNNEGEKNITRDIESADKHDCGLYPSSRCAVFVRDPKISAFRSRAMTSAGMLNIEALGASSIATPDKYKDLASQLWEKVIERSFGIKTNKAKEAADFMLANHLGTVRDNLRGQCTHGHSCKLSSLEKLQMTIDVLEEETGAIILDA